MGNPELDENDYIRYTRGTAPVKGFKEAKYRDDHPNQKRKRRLAEEAEKAKNAPLHNPTPPKSPIEKRLAKDENEEEVKEHNHLADVPFDLAYRGIEQDDFGFILKSWLLSYRDSKRDHTNTVYFRGQQNLIAEISKRRSLIIGCDAETPSFIVGFVCGTMLQDGRLLLDYIYVKHAYRERGIARGLLSQIGWTQDTEIVATHWTKQIDRVGRRYNAGHNSYFNSMGFSDV